VKTAVFRRRKERLGGGRRLLARRKAAPAPVEDVARHEVRHVIRSAVATIDRDSKTRAPKKLAHVLALPPKADYPYFAQMPDQVRRPDARCIAALPIFPLPNAVLLPGMVLPLSVFESRYIDLIDHVLRQGCQIGVPLLRPGYEEDYEGRPEIEPVFGVGRVLSHHVLPDGRRFVRLQGLGRVHLLEELAPRAPFREVTCEILREDEPRGHKALELLAAQVERIASSLGDEDAEAVRALLEIPDPRLMVYAVAAFVPNIDPDARLDECNGRCPRLELQQQCLAAETTDERVRLLIDGSMNISHDLSESGAFPVAVLN
jgi:Lon protease-like protein